ncbi:AAA family ATPase [Leekyejoonella antrihumi]|uniref:AAA family ATPase n=1 Tax=Leekyejoonella antrihumi TaxID=1660198 RepID=A0A563E6R9_9MICO|nr:AAA family ATPase [Leekyejoonella antrihumi]
MERATTHITVAEPAAPNARSERTRGTDPRPETVEQVLADLDLQKGQDAVKRQVRGLLAQTRAQLARNDAGLKQARPTEHFVFAGPPGTGKTTVARMIARLCKPSESWKTDRWWRSTDPGRSASTTGRPWLAPRRTSMRRPAEFSSSMSRTRFRMSDFLRATRSGRGNRHHLEADGGRS